MVEPGGAAGGSGAVVVTARVESGVAFVSLSGRLDTLGARSATPELDRVTAEPGPVVVDLSGVEFMESLGLALIVRLAKRNRALGLPLVVMPGSPAVARLIGLARLDRILTIVFTPEAARRAVGLPEVPEANPGLC